MTEYLQVRYSEPCVRGSLKLVHSSYIFLQEVAGIEDKLTDSSMYVVALKELMSQAIPGRPPRQAPRFPTILLAAFEDMVLAIDRPVFIRVLSWWLLVQSWGTLRFDDHRGLLPREFVVTSTGLQARLTRSKVSGSDKHLNYRTVIIHPSAYVQRESWLSVGWKLLQESAPHERDYLLPAPTNNYQGFKVKESKYSTAFAVQTKIISTATYRGLKVFGNSTGPYYTPHSGRNFMPSAASVLGFTKSERDVLGGWAADGSQRYTRTAKYKIAQMQIAVASTFKNSEPDQLAESDDLDCLADFLRSWEVPESSIRKSLQILSLRSYADLQRSDSIEPITADCDLAPGELALDILDEDAEARKKLSKEKQQAGNRGRSELLGSDHKQARLEIRFTIAKWILHVIFWQKEYPGRTLSGTLLHAACCRLLVLRLRRRTVSGLRCVRLRMQVVCEGFTVEGRPRVLRYEHFVLLRRVSLPRESSANFPETQARRAGSASHSSAN